MEAEEMGDDGMANVPRVLTVVGATRGIGRTSVALNVGVAAARCARRVCVLDAAGGLAARAGATERVPMLTDVVAGRARLGDALATSPDGVDVLTLGGPDRRAAAPLPESALLAHVDALEPHYDLVVVDAPSGAFQPLTRFFMAAATDVLLVVTPQQAALRQAQTLLRVLGAQCGRFDVLVLPNACAAPADATAVVQALAAASARPPHVRVRALGWIPFDQAVNGAKQARRALAAHDPESPAGRAFAGVAERLLSSAPARPTGGAQFFFETLIAQGRAA
jgi:flagellar biosynthesis protein FlhG